MTQQKDILSEGEVRRSSDLMIKTFKMLLDAITDQGVMICDTAGKILYYNSAVSLYDKIPQSQAIGKNYRELYHDDDGGCVAQVIKTQRPVRNRVTKFWDGKNEVKVCVDCAYPIWSEDMYTIQLDGKGDSSVWQVWGNQAEDPSARAMRPEEVVRQRPGAVHVQPSEKKSGEMLAAVLVITRYPEHVGDRLNEALCARGDGVPGCKYATQGAIWNFTDLRGSSAAFEAAVNSAKQAAFRTAPVLLVVEPGCEKEIFAQSIHNAGLAQDQPFITVRCAGLSEEQQDLALFGARQGALGNGEQAVVGAFEAAAKGTVFLDDVQCIAPHVQTKLVQVLREKRVRRLGAKSYTKITCRVISACGQPLVDCMRHNILREDLVYLLAEMRVDIPPLRQRKDDIPRLAARQARKQRYFSGRMSPEFMEALRLYAWPGNLDELRQTMEEALMAKAPGEELEVRHLPPSLRTLYLQRRAKMVPLQKDVQEWPLGEEDPAGAMQKQPLQEADEACGKGAALPQAQCLKAALDRAERSAIAAALAQHANNITRAAAALGISRSNLQYRIRKLGMQNK